ncbi:MAG TPA: 16S rRNA (guanine(527)-N(7))-methyltransferase RsmG [Saprospiraceae bacterium]|nr:16S rRNA (guanine(527)-N(7))-methyltransferase RsmG [Saprospiraceae bacterium]
MNLIKKYFPDLTEQQLALFEQLSPLYREWNDKINVVSRQDIENLEERHVLHSLAIAKVISFQPGAKLLDLGTGGGFPGIPLAILFPEAEFVLVDGTGKKIRVVQEVATALGLSNVTALHARAEELKMNGQFDFVITRGVTTLDKLLVWTQKFLKKKHIHVLPNGLIALKGGDIHREILELPGKGKEYTEVFPIRNYFREAFFDEKAVVYVQG